LAGKLEGKKPLGRCGHRWKDNIKQIFEKQDESVKSIILKLMVYM
jgi:hypothetical protein